MEEYGKRPSCNLPCGEGAAQHAIEGERVRGLAFELGEDRLGDRRVVPLMVEELEVVLDCPPVCRVPLNS